MSIVKCTGCAANLDNEAIDFCPTCRTPLPRPNNPSKSSFLRWIAMGMLVLMGLCFGLSVRTGNESDRHFHRTYDAIRVGMSIKDVPIFSDDAVDAARRDFVGCQGQESGPILDRDEWRSLVKSTEGFPAVCRTMYVFLPAASLLESQHLSFDLEFDDTWHVSKIGPKKVHLRG